MNDKRFKIDFYQTASKWYWRIQGPQRVLADGFVDTVDEASETIEEWLRNYRTSGGFS